MKKSLLALVAGVMVLGSGGQMLRPSSSKLALNQETGLIII